MTALAVAGYWSLRLAYADSLFRANTLESVTRATGLDPGNARYHAWLAEMHEYEGRSPAAELQVASALNPSDSAVWIRRALHAEGQRDFGRAEEFLLEAARIDKLYSPRWALANYYARRGDIEHFWPWARQAIAIGYDDLTPMFRLCWSVTDNAELIRTRAIPPLQPVLGRYLAFLTREDRLDAAAPIARGVSDRPILLSYCDRLIEDKRAEEAVSVWKALFPSAPLPLTNGSFDAEPLQQGFDWRLPAQPGISVTRGNSAAALRFRLSGRQAEHCELLSQFLPLTPGQTYTFRFEYKAPLRGLRWNVDSLARSAELRAEDWTSGELRFTAGNDSIARLALTYDRDPGAVRAEGEIWLRNASIR